MRIKKFNENQITDINRVFDDIYEKLSVITPTDSYLKSDGEYCYADDNFNVKMWSENPTGYVGDSFNITIPSIFEIENYSMFSEFTNILNEIKYVLDPYKDDYHISDINFCIPTKKKDPNGSYIELYIFSKTVKV